MHGCFEAVTATPGHCFVQRKAKPDCGVSSVCCQTASACAWLVLTVLAACLPAPAVHSATSPLQVMQKMERWIVEHRKDPRSSRLRRMVPTIGSFFVPLKCAAGRLLPRLAWPWLHEQLPAFTLPLSCLHIPVMQLLSTVTSKAHPSLDLPLSTDAFASSPFSLLQAGGCL